VISLGACPILRETSPITLHRRMGERHNTTYEGWCAYNRLSRHGLLLLPLQAQAERNWEFSVGAFGGKAYHSNESMKFSEGQGGIVTAGTAYDINLNDTPTFGEKLTA
jgi:hypothetical protein